MSIKSDKADTRIFRSNKYLELDVLNATTIMTIMTVEAQPSGHLFCGLVNIK